MKRPYRGGGGNYRRRANNSRSPRPKGQIKQGKSVQYKIESPSGETTQIGVTNNPRRRAAEHQRSDKMRKGDKIKIETKPVSRKTAERIETRKLSEYRAKHGRNPRHNKTNDGKYHR